jgi:3-oxoacyl-[acyl-carrier-protein] synthase-3
MAPSQLVNYLLFGDAAGAVVISADTEGAAMRLKAVFSRFAGVGRAPGQTIEWYGDGTRDDRSRPAISEDYKAIEAHVPAMSAQALAELLALAGWSDDEVDYLLPPQLSGVMTPKIRKELGLDGAVEISCVAETGNSGNALPFLQLDRLAELIAPGEKAAAIAIESSRWIKGGFAVEGL